MAVMMDNNFLNQKKIIFKTQRSWIWKSMVNNCVVAVLSQVSFLLSSHLSCLHLILQTLTDHPVCPLLTPALLQEPSSWQFNTLNNCPPPRVAHPVCGVEDYYGMCGGGGLGDRGRWNEPGDLWLSARGRTVSAEVLVIDDVQHSCC